MNELRRERENLMGELSIIKHKQSHSKLDRLEEVRKHQVIKEIMVLDAKLEVLASQIY